MNADEVKYLLFEKITTIGGRRLHSLLHRAERLLGPHCPAPPPTTTSRGSATQQDPNGQSRRFG
ncbi:hypothetical protein FDA94_01580 [Herbidospora galbida]|uniref:Uncharacterized protein n=1 Tax=Herbidospora galbida TaxID=2575442 RepID=A0A4U3MPG4_9ACTN|nr:hypothetical protein [Herbidospora galbida]TKK91501.1 hypothetical protein FDA94_01580 [Herbidospora galbida]